MGWRWGGVGVRGVGDGRGLVNNLEYDYNEDILDIYFMFGKVKQFIVDKAFGFAFMRYDRDSSGMLNKD